MKVSRRWASWVVIGSLAILLLAGVYGCGKDEVVDPYMYASLNAIMKGAVKDTVSRNFAFEIDAPEFDYVRGQVGIVRDGNRLYYFVARDLENLYPRLAGTLLGVKQTFSPQPTHLVLERIKRGGVVEQDSMAGPEPYVLPKLLRAGAVDIREPGKNLGEANWKDEKTLSSLLPEEEGDALLRFQTGIDKLVWVPRHDLPDSERNNPSDKDMAFYAVLPTGTFQIVDLAPGADYMLHLLISRDLPLVGSVTPVSWVDDRLARRQEYPVIGHVVGTLRINWFKYANTFVEGYREI
ncbi:MAG TPA: hypothetical protein PLL30_06390 [Candidatus Krumholzibacteria bacterium]|nr:hypothetical protein [Candidatus Krumholzibacteria bacterium]HPD71394.1 hypothetical protein [Candidatus Krumholzibacteria bacterium]HRY38906.1 hypothetical protein [Candidatus Krumholzibacteria bacterium]